MEERRPVLRPPREQLVVQLRRGPQRFRHLLTNPRQVVRGLALVVDLVVGQLAQGGQDQPLDLVLGPLLGVVELERLVDVGQVLPQDPSLLAQRGHGLLAQRLQGPLLLAPGAPLAAILDPVAGVRDQRLLVLIDLVERGPGRGRGAARQARQLRLDLVEEGVDRLGALLGWRALARGSGHAHLAGRNIELEIPRHVSTSR